MRISRTGAAGLVALLSMGARLTFAQKPPSGQWVGRAVTERSSDLRWATLTIRYESDFWFTLSENSDVRGFAITNYRMSIDDARLRDAISGLKGAASAGAGAAVGAGALGSLLSLLGSSASALGDIVGMTSSFDEGLAVRSGEIRGRLAGSEISLDWASPPPEIPYKTLRLYPTRQETITAKSGPAYSPWSARAQVSRGAGGWSAVVPESQRRAIQGQLTRTSYWYARFVGASQK